jgi:radical SAM protein with 4Fe4S-binding SPASM domain
MLPVSERRKPYHKEKFATQDKSSKNAKRCPKCKAIYYMAGECPNCRYKHLYNEDMPGIKKASELDNE